ncbi:hypothetical protein WG936_05055 [Corynebacterium sp. H127]
MNWLNVVEQVLSQSGISEGVPLLAEAGQSHVEYDDTGLTVFADVDGDGVIDQVSRMDYSGEYCTLVVGENMSLASEASWELWEESTPESGQHGNADFKQVTGWTCADWG